MRDMFSCIGELEAEAGHDANAECESYRCSGACAK